MRDLNIVRQDRADALAGLAAIESVRANRTEARATVAEWVKSAAARGNERLADAVQGVQRSARLDARAAGFELGSMTLSGNGLDLAPLLCALIGPDRVTKALCAHLDPIDDGPDAAQRREAADALKARLYHLEVLEEALIVESERTTAPALRRVDADPAVVLMLPDDLAVAVEAARAALESQS